MYCRAIVFLTSRTGTPDRLGQGRRQKKIGTDTEQKWGEEAEGRKGHVYLPRTDGTANKLALLDLQHPEITVLAESQISLVPHDAPLSEITPASKAARPGEEESSPGSYYYHSKGEKLKATYLQVGLYTYLLLVILCCSVLLSTSRISASFSKWTTAKSLPSPYNPLNTYICILRWIQNLTLPQTCLCRSDHNMEDYITKCQSEK